MTVHDMLVTLLAWLLIVGALLHAVGTWRQLGHETTEFVWSLGSAQAALMVGALQLLLLHDAGDAGLALLATVGALAWAAVAQRFGHAIRNRYDFRVIWHVGCGIGLAFLSAITLVVALL